MTERFRGVLPPLPTPFEEGKVAVGRFVENLSHLHDTGLAGYVVLGSNGEANLLTENEKLDLIRVSRAVIAQEDIMLVGTGLESTDATIKFTNQAADCGADAALVITPSFYRPSRDDLRRHYEVVAENAAIPILLYNVPKYTGLNMSTQLAEELAQHPNIVGMKDSAGNIAQLVELLEKLPDAFSLFLGSDAVLFAGMAHGVPGAILALANIAPNECVGLYQAVQNERWEEAKQLARILTPVGRTVVGKYGVPGLKAALDFVGSYGGAPRLPLQQLDEFERLEIREVLERAGLL